MPDDKLDEERERMVWALTHIAARGCESFTTGIGSCFVEGRTPDAKYTAEKCCNPCIAHAALNWRSKSEIQNH